MYQHSSETIEEIVDGEKRTLYLGVDPTADSMHVGQLMGILVLRRFVENGHKLIVVVGGGTGMIGDPGGKSSERVLLDEATVAKNTEALRTQFSQLLGGVPFEMVNNADWLHPLNYMEFLRDIGKHFTVNEMIKRDTVRPRIETPDQSISYTEFSYMLLQAYDFLELHKRYGCDLQIGGSDQWGNIISGVELIRRKTGDKAYAMSWPLLVDKKTNKKFGKSEGNAVWLDAIKTSPFQFYQFWLNADDEMVEELLLKMTTLAKDEIGMVMEEQNKERGMRVAQKRLALEVTTLVHGSEQAQSALRTSEVLFGDTDPKALSPDDVFNIIAYTTTPKCGVTIGESIIDVLVKSGLAASKREARQFVTDGAVKVNGEKIDDTKMIGEGDLLHGSGIFLKRGKKHLSVLYFA